jgi:hypothetical protein
MGHGRRLHRPGADLPRRGLPRRHQRPEAFPDLGPNEYLLYDIALREIAGIQVKSVTFPVDANEAHVSVYHPALSRRRSLVRDLSG